VKTLMEQNDALPDNVVYDAVVPAGGTLEGDFRNRAGCSLRALAPIGRERRPVLQLVVDALRGSRRVGNIVVVGDPSVSPHVTGVDEWIAEEPRSGRDGVGQGPANVLRGLSELPRHRAAIVCTSDLPFLTSSAVDGFLDRLSPEVGISAGLVAADDYQRRYADSPPSQFVKLLETGPVAMSCVFCVVPDVLLSNKHALDRAFSARKSQLKTASLLGMRLTYQYVTGRLSLAAIVRRVESILQCRIGVVQDVEPELAFDVDTVEDYCYAAAARSRA
jgi:GTP:adenosylcobinamide-phosphate guanylyltransferase